MASADVDLEEVYRKFYPIVSSRVLGALGRGTPDWEDVVQRVFLSIIEMVRSGKFRGDANIGTIIYIITERRVTDLLRERYRDATLLPSSGRPPWPPSGDPLRPQPEELIFDVVQTEFEVRQMFTAVLGGMDKLSPRQREVFTLCGLGEKTVAEVAKALGLSRGRVQKAYTRARENLAKRLESWRPEEVSDVTLLAWFDRFWEAYIRLGQRKKRLKPETFRLANIAREAIIARLVGRR